MNLQLQDQYSELQDRDRDVANSVPRSLTINSTRELQAWGGRGQPVLESATVLHVDSLPTVYQLYCYRGPCDTDATDAAAVCLLSLCNLVLQAVSFPRYLPRLTVYGSRRPAEHAASILRCVHVATDARSKQPAVFLFTPLCLRPHRAETLSDAFV